MAIINESTAADLDTSQAEQGIIHEANADRDIGTDDTIQKGDPSTDNDGSALVAHYPFDENTGTVANDISANANDGTYSGATLAQTGILGSTCISFPGPFNTNEVTLPQLAAIEGTTTFTIAAWFQTNTLPSSGGNLTLFDYGDDFDNHIQLRHHPETTEFTCRVETAADGADIGIPHSSLNTTDWFHVALVFSSGTVEAYLNGVSQGTESMTTETTSPTLTNPPRIGISLGQASGTQWNGRIDEVRIYSRALTATQVAGLHDTAAGTSEYWADKKVS